MDKSIQVIRMRQAGHSINRIGESLKMCKKTIKRILEDPSLEKPLPDIEFHCPLPNEPKGPKWLQELDCDALVKQIQKGVSYQILYQEQTGISVGYWSFWHALSRLVKATKAPPTTMRLKHVPGEKAFTAYANHAGFAVLPARSNRPKDKANVECHAGLIQRTFYQEVRNPNLLRCSLSVCGSKSQSYRYI